LALGLNAGLGNFGVTTMQIVIPLVMTAGIFGAIGGEPMALVKDSGTLIGRIPAGSDTWIQNAGWVWMLLLVPLAIIGWFGRNNLLPITPNPGHTLAAFGKILGLYGVGFLTAAARLYLYVAMPFRPGVPDMWLALPLVMSAAAGLYLYLPKPFGLGVLNMWLAMPLIMIATLGLLRMLPGSIKPNIKRQFEIFRDKHTWSMSVLYILTFGSFIGFSMALPLSIT